jgi:hypothetical protein
MQRKLLTFASIPILIYLIVMTAHLLGLMGNKEMFGFRYQFDYAQIRLPNGEIVEGEISAWARENKTDSIRVTFKDGHEYLTNTSNMILYNRGKHD